MAAAGAVLTSGVQIDSGGESLDEPGSRISEGISLVPGYVVPGYLGELGTRVPGYLAGLGRGWELPSNAIKFLPIQVGFPCQWHDTSTSSSTSTSTRANFRVGVSGTMLYSHGVDHEMCFASFHCHAQS
eukprot:542056-Rhodomonas_salina.1